MTAQKTFWHLMQQRRMPTEYEVVTSKLLCYTGEGFTGKRFELEVPLADWYRRYQQESLLRCASWEAFKDPRETTYTRYTEIQRDKEIFVDEILQEIELSGYDRQISSRWLQVLSEIVAPLRYPYHGLQMLASYAGQMAPGGRIVITAALQSADEMRRIQRIAYRIRQLQQVYSGFAADSRSRWERDPMWQPLRIAVERLLVCYDWAECFVGLNLVLKPLIDELFMNHLSEVALREGDHLLGQVFYSLNEDCRWHRDWSRALVQAAIADQPGNKTVIQSWIEKWHPLAVHAVNGFIPVFREYSMESSMPLCDEVISKLDASYKDYMLSMGLSALEIQQ